jgi:hypothetical protein
MNRSYQSRVTQVEIPDPAEKGKWLLFHANTDTARTFTGLIPELRQKVNAEITARPGLSVEEQKRRPKSPELWKTHLFGAGTVGVARVSSDSPLVNRRTSAA